VSLLDEILACRGVPGSLNEIHPIILIPQNEYEGNISMKNAFLFLSKGE